MDFKEKLSKNRIRSVYIFYKTETHNINWNFKLLLDSKLTKTAERFFYRKTKDRIANHKDFFVCKYHIIDYIENHINNYEF